jgi:IS30 family transposase
MKKVEHRQNIIAGSLGRSPSAISRLLQCNRGLPSYHPGQDKRLTESRCSENYKATKVTVEVWSWIVSPLDQKLSPQQITGYLNRLIKLVSLVGV